MKNIVIEALFKQENSIIALINIDNKFKELKFINESDISSMIRFINSDSILIDKNIIFEDKKDYNVYYDMIINKNDRVEVLRFEFDKLTEFIKENGEKFGFSYQLDDLEFIDWGESKIGTYPKTIIFPNNIRLDKYEDGSLTFDKNNKEIFPVLEKYLELIDSKIEIEIN